MDRKTRLGETLFGVEQTDVGKDVAAAFLDLNRLAHAFLITKPPMQTRRTSPPTASSNSRRKERQGSGTDSRCGMSQIFDVEVGKHIPFPRFRRPMLSQPIPLGFG